MKQPAQLERTISLTLAMNLKNALKVAGPQNEKGLPSKLTSVEVHRTTGIARSTLRALNKLTPSQDANPDLRTLCRIADELHIPVAFLLMGPREWRTLLKAFGEIESPEIKAAATKQEKLKGLSEPQAALQILYYSGVYPLPSPVLTGEHEAQELTSLNRKNEAFRRATLVTAALLQTAEFDPNSLKTLTLLAATHANNDKSHFLSSL
jgi:hypothetical protein